MVRLREEGTVDDLIEGVLLPPLLVIAFGPFRRGEKEVVQPVGLDLVLVKYQDRVSLVLFCCLSCYWRPVWRRRFGG
jgi:hypothetical protein